MVRGRSKKETMEIDGKQVEVTNLRKVFWPEEAITKGDLIAYYREISKYILPYLQGRPQNLNRHPNGINGKHFYQKDVDEAPEWVKTVRIESESSEVGSVNYLVCQDGATLVYLANLGCIEINPWNSRIGSLDQPDYLVIDLDPDERSFADVIRVAQITHQILEEAGARNLVKTSGKTGLHVYVPLGAQYSYEQGRQFAQQVGQLVHQQRPDITSLERNPKNRRGKIYLDYLQNSRGQTLAAPYSLRPKAGAPVSTPLDWSELHPDLSPLDFSYFNIRERLKARGDLFRPILGPGIDMPACLEKLEQTFALRPKED